MSYRSREDGAVLRMSVTVAIGHLKTSGCIWWVTVRPGRSGLHSPRPLQVRALVLSGWQIGLVLHAWDIHGYPLSLRGEISDIFYFGYPLLLRGGIFIWCTFQLMFFSLCCSPLWRTPSRPHYRSHITHTSHTIRQLSCLKVTNLSETARSGPERTVGDSTWICMNRVMLYV